MNFPPKYCIFYLHWSKNLYERYRLHNQPSLSVNDGDFTYFECGLELVAAVRLPADASEVLGVRPADRVNLAVRKAEGDAFRVPVTERDEVDRCIGDRRTDPV